MNNLITFNRCSPFGLQYALQFTQKSYKKCDFDYIVYGLYTTPESRFNSKGLYLHRNPSNPGTELIGGIFAKDKYIQRVDILYEKSVFVEDMLSLFKRMTWPQTS